MGCDQSGRVAVINVKGPPSSDAVAENTGTEATENTEGTEKNKRDGSTDFADDTD